MCRKWAINKPILIQEQGAQDNTLGRKSQPYSAWIHQREATTQQSTSPNETLKDASSWGSVINLNSITPNIQHQPKRNCGSRQRPKDILNASQGQEQKQQEAHFDYKSDHRPNEGRQPRSLCKNHQKVHIYYEQDVQVTIVDDCPWTIWMSKCVNDCVWTLSNTQTKPRDRRTWPSRRNARPGTLN